MCSTIKPNAFESFLYELKNIILLFMNITFISLNIIELYLKTKCAYKICIQTYFGKLVTIIIFETPFYFQYYRHQDRKKKCLWYGRNNKFGLTIQNISFRIIFQFKNLKKLFLQLMDHVHVLSTSQRSIIIWNMNEMSSSRLCYGRTVKVLLSFYKEKIK